LLFIEEKKKMFSSVAAQGFVFLQESQEETVKESAKRNKK